MKKLSSLLSTLTFKNAGCSKSLFDPLFAQELQKRGYVADAENIKPEEVKGITELDVSGRLNQETHEYEGELTSLRGIEYFESLTILLCYGNQLTSLDVNQNTALKFLDCRGNKLTTLDVSPNTALITLVCSINQLTTLDVSNNTALKFLGCNNNKLTSLDVNNNTALTELWCDNNQLTSLNLGNNTR